ncbi:MAG: alcohol dehydrogenase catalytic domain-containing protein [Ktedonobacteraceae bacterium]
MSKQRFDVQRHLDHAYVARQNGDVPQPQPGEALLQMVACGICGADVRVVTRNKAASGEAGRYTTLGHEGIGRVVALGDNIPGLQPGDYAVVLPHIHDHERAPQCFASSINPVCIGCGHTLHMGWDIDGCFADFMVVPITNIVRIDRQYLHIAARQAPRLREAVFALVEPMLCTLSAYELAEIHLQHELSPGGALVIGCGPIGILHSLALLDRGFEVWLTDTVRKRTELAQWCLDHRGRVFDPERPAEMFDLVMVTASSSAAVRTAEEFVRKGGIVYLFAGLNTADRAAMDRENLFLYESLHRRAQGIRTTLRLGQEEKSVLYLGHSGYFEHLAPRAIAAVAANAAALDRAVTGIIPGFASPRIISRLPGGVDWTTGDESPAIVAILNGTDLRERHCKLLVLPDAEKYS